MINLRNALNVVQTFRNEAKITMHFQGIENTKLKA